MPTNRADDCPLCGAPEVGGEDGCRRIFESVLAKEYDNPAFGEVHLITVDAYALQHGDAHGPRSNPYHLVAVVRDRGVWSKSDNWDSRAAGLAGNAGSGPSVAGNTSYGQPRTGDSRGRGGGGERRRAR